MKAKSLKICDATIQPGERANLALPLPELYSCTSFYMPIRVVHGKRAGPCVVIFAAVDGHELNGMEIINRLLGAAWLDNLNGTIIAIPILNVAGLVKYPRNLSQEHSINHCFPGDLEGTYGERIAYIFTQEILRKATHCIELSTGSLNHEILPQVYVNLANKEDRRLAQAFQAPVITNVNLEKHTLRTTTEQLHASLLVYQSGEAMRFDPQAINVGVAGVLNVLHALDMLTGYTPADNPDFKPVFSQDDEWIRAHRSGVLYPTIELGQMVKALDMIGRIVDPFSADIAEPVTAPVDGIIVGINKHPLIYEGQSIIKISSFIDNEKAESMLESWGETTPELPASDHD